MQARVNFEELLEAECSPGGFWGLQVHLQGPQQVHCENQAGTPHRQMGRKVTLVKYDHMFPINKVCALWEKTLFILLEPYSTWEKAVLQPQSILTLQFHFRVKKKSYNTIVTFTSHGDKLTRRLRFRHQIL